MFYPHTIKGKPISRLDLIVGEERRKFDTLRLNGSNQALRSLGATPIGNQSNSFSMSVNMYMTGVQPDWGGSIIYSQGADDQPFVGIILDGGFVHARVNDAIEDYNVIHAPSYDEWHNYTMTYNGPTKEIELFVDGVSSGTLTFEGVYPQLSNISMGQTYIGRVTANYAELDMSNALVFDKLLTAGDIAELQTVRPVLDYSSSITDNYLLAIPLNSGNSGQEFTDQSANNTVMSLINNPTINGAELQYTLT